VLALDLPGRRNKPGNLREMTISDYVDSLVSDSQKAGLEEIVLVGHSLGGITLPGVLANLGTARVQEMIFAAAFLPPVGTSIVESSPWVIRAVARRIETKNVPTPTPK
jgi:surfactin synthase thioesterase subunit